MVTDHKEITWKTGEPTRKTLEIKRTATDCPIGQTLVEGECLENWAPGTLES